MDAADLRSGCRPIRLQVLRPEIIDGRCGFLAALAEGMVRIIADGGGNIIENSDRLVKLTRCFTTFAAAFSSSQSKPSGFIVAKLT